MDIVVENLTKSFKHKKAVESISFTARKGEITGFLGPNGAGKTTIMKILSGFLYPDEGNIFYGKKAHGKKPFARTAAVISRVKRLLATSSDSP